MDSKVQKKVKNVFRLLLLVVWMQTGWSVNVSAALSGSRQAVEVSGISIHVKDATLDRVFSIIKEQTGYVFSYSKAIQEDTKRFTLDYDKIALEDVLRIISAEGNYQYRQVGKNISFKKLPENPNEESGVPARGDRKIEGRVTDAKTGEPLTGATIAIKELDGKGTVTDTNGKFALVLPEGRRTLVVSFIGYQPKELKITSASELDIRLSPNEENLNEVVVVGYGKKSSSDITSSITSLSAEDFNKGPATNINYLLQGKAAGVLITSDGDPSNSGSIIIRGTSTLRADGQSPLYVIDGIPSVGVVAPQDIVSINILKDASAAAIYGSRAANGVILITTRQGQQKEKSYVNFNAYTNIESVANRYEMMTADEYRNYLTSNGTAIDEGWDDGVSKDWQKEIMRTAVSRNYYLNLGGTGNGTTYDASINYLDQEGIIKTTNLKKLIARANVDRTILNNHLTLGMTANLTIASHDLLDFPFYTYRGMLTFLPTVNATDEDGVYKQDLDNKDPNPIAMINQTTLDQRDETIMASFRAAYNDLLLKGLDYHLTLSYSNDRIGRDSYISKEAEFNPGVNGEASRNTYLDNSLIFENYLSFNRKFGKHDFGGILGYSWQEDKNNNGFQSTNINFVSDATGYNNLGLGSSADGYKVDYGDEKMTSLRMISFYTRFNYSYGQRYILQASLRRDGSSAFGENNRWGLFPSVSGAWRIIGEKFMAGQNVFNNLKLRVGYGISGNSIGFDPLISRLRYGITGVAYYQGNSINAIGPVANANNDLKWEKTAMLNVGLDMAFFDSRLEVSAEYYNKLTSDLIWDYEVSSTQYLYSSLTANVGKMRNKGVELNISAVPVHKANFTWSTSLLLSHNKNVIESLSDDRFKMDYALTASDAIGAGQSGGSAQIIKEGYALGTFYTLRFAGFDENGQSLFYDADGNKTDSPIAPDDYFTAGDAQPKLQFSWSNGITYKKFSLDLMFSGVLGHDVLNATLAGLNYTSRASDYNMPKYVLDSNQPFNDTRSHFVSDRYIEKADYVRLQNLMLSYNFNLAEKSQVKNLNLYFSTNNLFTITGYKGIDPEVNMGGNEPGIDYNNLYPKTKSFQLGVKITL
jgi:iron complex outermembrane receptor protein